MFFATLVGMQEHPGYTREGMRPKTVRECAEMADMMLEELLCRLSQLESQQADRC